MGQSRLMMAEASLEIQLALLCTQAVAWFIIINAGSTYIVEPWVKRQPWEKQWTTLNRKTFKTGFMIDFKTDLEAFKLACAFILIISQHAIGGAFCVPSIAGAAGAWA